MMELIQFQEHQKEFLGKLLEVCRAKQREYADGKNAFHNFEEAVGFSTHNSREACGWEFCVKHLQSVRDIINNVDETGTINGFADQALLDEKFGDIIVYMTLLHGMLTDRIKENEKQTKVVHSH